MVGHWAVRTVAHSVAQTVVQKVGQRVEKSAVR